MSIQPGTIGLTQISGNVGRLIRFGQLLNGDGFADYQHAFLAIDGPGLPEGSILEAEPGGARVGNVSEYSNIYWCENIAAKYGKALTGVVAAAAKYRGVPYSFLDYLAIAQRRLHLPTLGFRSYVASTGHLICSQLCARAYFDAGCPLYSEWTGYVTPLDLYNLDRSLRN
jgi:cell wall-associated NlpC family hydrolase